MISHKHKCIFIHISKCAGSSVETQFGIDISDISENNNINLFGWNQGAKLFLQHATPQQLIENNFLDKKTWDSYYKFIIVRNPWSRAFSDYKWLCREIKKKDNFTNFLKRKGLFKDVLRELTINYRGDHLNKQIDYFYLNGQLINYQKVIKFEKIKTEFPLLASELGLSKDFFKVKINVDNTKVIHYSKFYNYFRRKLVEKIYREDIDFLNYTFEDKRNIFDYSNIFKSSKKLI